MPPKVPKDEFSAWQHDKLQTKAGFMRAQKEAIAYFMKTHPHLFKTFVQPQYDGVMTRNRAGVPGAPRIGTGFKSTFAPPTQQPSQPEPASSPLVSRLRNERFDDISSPSHSSVSRSPKKVTLNVNGFDLSRKLDEPEENEEDMPEDSQYAEETSQISEQPSTSSSSTSVRRKHRRNLNNVVENSSPIPEKKWRKESQVAESNDKEVKENGKPENDDTPSTSNSASSPVKVIAAKKRGGSKGGKRSKNKQEDEPTYCTCSRISFGEMIGCDNDKCEIEWFHFECVSLTSKPKGKWYCPGCRHPELGAKTPRSAKGSRQEKA